jgi:hypothetical protein
VKLRLRLSRVLVLILSPGKWQVASPWGGREGGEGGGRGGRGGGGARACVRARAV